MRTLTTELERHLGETDAAELGDLTVREYGEALSLVFGEQWRHEPGYRWLDMGALTAKDLDPARPIAQGIALAQSKGDHNKATNLLAQLGQLLYDALKADANVEISGLLYRIDKRRDVPLGDAEDHGLTARDFVDELAVRS